jgi:formyltetrahydrofolate deformylase
MRPDSPTAILLAHGADRGGLVLAFAAFIREYGGNILHLDQHVDHEEGIFFVRIEWELEGFGLGRDEIVEKAGQVAGENGLRARVRFSDQARRTAIFVSKEGHCLDDLLARHASGELPVDVRLVVGNHATLAPVAARFGIPFVHIPATLERREEAEREQLALLEEGGIETVVLARYMQVLTEGFVARYPEQIINIHHSFLPAFPGARPYHSAHARGVKIIGATSHYVTAELDGGPIIHQDVAPVSHRDSVRDFIRKGRDLERIVLARAVWWHARDMVLAYHAKTVVFR